MTYKKIGVLTSGGDCPGLNAVIRSVVKCATRIGWDVYGVPYGTDGFIHVYQGLVRPEELLLKEHGYDIPGQLQGLDVLQFLSGSILGSLSKGNPEQPEIQEKILGGYQILGLDALVAIGGDGSLEIIHGLAEKGGWKMVGVPKTIDNDVPFTERSVGFDTAVNTVTKALYDLTFTAASHERVIVVEVMGRDAGHLALHSGIAGGADFILLPEITPILTDTIVNQICDRLAEMRRRGRMFALVVISEGVKNRDGQKEKYIGDYLATQIRECSLALCNTGKEEYCTLDNVDTRSTVLGHIQRSGIPTASDRLLAIAFGKMAVDLIAEEKYNQLVVWESGRVQIKPLSEVLPILKRCHQEKCCPGPIHSDDYMFQVAKSLGIYVGEGNPSIAPESTPLAVVTAVV